MIASTLPLSPLALKSSLKVPLRCLKSPAPLRMRVSPNTLTEPFSFMCTEVAVDDFFAACFT